MDISRRGGESGAQPRRLLHERPSELPRSTGRRVAQEPGKDAEE